MVTVLAKSADANAMSGAATVLDLPAVAAGFVRQRVIVLGRCIATLNGRRTTGSQRGVWVDGASVIVRGGETVVRTAAADAGAWELGYVPGRGQGVFNARLVYDPVASRLRWIGVPAGGVPAFQSGYLVLADDVKAAAE